MGTKNTNLTSAIIYALALCACNVFSSCASESKKPVYEDIATHEETYDETPVDTNEIVIPFKVVNGVKYLPVKVNGIGLEMIFDTGCSGALISSTEANYLYQKGLITDEDFLGVTQLSVADGSVVENAVINLK